MKVDAHETNPQPLMSFNIGLFLKSRKDSKDMYNVLSRKTVQIYAEQKWVNILNKYDIEWKNIHFHCTKHTKNTNFAGFISIIRM
jgi:Fe-S cluster assembly iron-binding protein IscA